MKNKKSMVVSGKIFSGKTTKFMFHQVDEIINKEENFLVNDTYGDYLARYNELLSKEKYNIMVLNFKDPSHSIGFNPLLYSYCLYKKGNIDEALNSLEETYESIIDRKSSSDPFWNNTAKDLLVGLSLILFENGDLNEINFQSIYNILDSFKIKYDLDDYVTKFIRNIDNNSVIYHYCSPTTLAPIETKGGILTVAIQYLKLLVNYENTNNILKNTTFDYNDIKSKKTAIFIISGQSSILKSFVIKTFIKQLITNINGEKEFNYILDDVSNLSYFNDLASIINEGYHKKSYFFLATRNYEELINLYGNDLSEVTDKYETIDENIYLDGEIIKCPTLDLNCKEYSDIKPLKSNNYKIFNFCNFVDQALPKNISNNSEKSINFETLIANIDQKIADMEKLINKSNDK